MTGRPDDGYSVAARIESRSSRRGRIVAIVVGLVVVAWGATVLGNAPADRGGATGSGRVGHASGPPGPGGPTFPLDVTILDPRAPTTKLPVRLAGLELLDPRAGTVDALEPVSWLQFPFATVDGSVCVCVEPGTGAGAPSVLHVTSFYDSRVPFQDLIVSNWLPLGDASGIAIQANQVPGGSVFVVASAIRLGEEWTVRLDWLDTATGDRANEIVDAIDGATWSASDVGLGLAIAPDGRRLRLWLGAEPSGQPASPPPSSPRIWTVPIAERGFGTPVRREEPWKGDPLTLCPGQAWASPTDFVQLCQAEAADNSGALRTTLRIDRGAGGSTEVDIGNALPEEATGWLVDGARGRVYGWFGMSHRLVRIDVATGRLTERSPREGQPDLLGIPPDASMPPARASGAIWQPFTGALSPLVGSPGGGVLYAAGLQPRSGLGVSAFESSGIWAFDADSLALVAHWLPAADYNVLSLTADGRTLIAYGPPAGEEVAQFGSQGPLVVFHDARDGSVLGILRALNLRIGGFPEPLAPPLPGGFGG